MMTVVTERADLNWAPALFFAVNGCLTVSVEISSSTLKAAWAVMQMVQTLFYLWCCFYAQQIYA
jgi:hypothetical protein